MDESIQESEQPESIAQLLTMLRAKGVSPSTYKYEIDYFLDSKARMAGVPRTGQFELTPLCNLDCKMCYVHLHRDQMKGVEPLSVDQWKHLMREAYDAGMAKAALTGGECLTYPGFDELYLFLQDLGVEVFVKTNGVLLDEKRIEFFRLHPPAAIQVSLYGASEEAYFKVTGKRVFETVLHNLRAADAAGLPVAVAITPSKYMDDAAKTIRMVNEMGLVFIVNSILFDPVEETGRKGQNADISLDKYVELVKLQRELRGANVPLVEVIDLPDVGGHDADHAVGVRCASGRSHFDLDWHGMLSGCCNFRQMSADPWELGFAEAWRKVNAASEAYMFPPECDGCPYYDCCHHCPGDIALLAPDGHATPELCARGMRMAKEGLGKLVEG